MQVETYFFSCNLDHVLHNIRNLSRDKKEDYADKFAERFENKEEEFIEFLNQGTIPMEHTYEESWTQIKVGLRSLHRHTNLHIFFQKNKEFLKIE